MKIVDFQNLDDCKYIPGELLTPRPAISATIPKKMLYKVGPGKFKKK